MKFSASGRRLIALASFALLAACGGGADDESGSSSALHFTGGELEVTRAGCPAYPNVRTITVSGGTGPYTVVNNYESVIEIAVVGGQASRTIQVGRMIPFTVSFLGGCFEMEDALTIFEHENGGGDFVAVPLTYKSS